MHQIDRAGLNPSVPLTVIDEPGVPLPGANMPPGDRGVADRAGAGQRGAGCSRWSCWTGAIEPSTSSMPPLMVVAPV